MHAAQREMIHVCGSVCLRGTPEKGTDYLYAQIVTDIGSVSWKKYKVRFFLGGGMGFCGVIQMIPDWVRRENGTGE